YGAEHYENPLLNSAHFFLRVDKQSVFSDAILKVKEKLRSQGAPIEISGNFGASATVADDLQPKEDVSVELHHIFVDSDAATKVVASLLDQFPTFVEGD